MFFGMGSSSSKIKKNSGSKKNLTLGKKVTALIVDDNPIIRKIHKTLMNKLGFETQVVENGKEAIDLCHSGTYFDLIIMDMEMPVMDGPTATRELRAMGVNIMIVGVTSRCQDSEKQAFMAAGLDDCHEKPLTVDTVTSLLQELVKNH